MTGLLVVLLLTALAASEAQVEKNNAPNKLAAGLKQCAKAFQSVLGLEIPRLSFSESDVPQLTEEMKDKLRRELQSLKSDLATNRRYVLDSQVLRNLKDFIRVIKSKYNGTPESLMETANSLFDLGKLFLKLDSTSQVIGLIYVGLAAITRERALLKARQRQQ